MNLGSLNVGDHVLMCEHLVRENWCNVTESAGPPRGRVIVKPGGEMTRDDGSKGYVVMAAQCTPTHNDWQFWEMVWNGQRFILADAGGPR